MHDAVVAPALIQDAVRRSPRLSKVLADQGYQGPTMRTACAAAQLTLEITQRPMAQRGAPFVLMPRRWVVERTFAWLSRCRRVDRARERLHHVHAAFIHVAFIVLLTARLT